MKNFDLKELSKIALILLAGCFIGYIGFSIKSSKVTNAENKITFQKKDISNATKITCTYLQTLNANYSDSEISHILPKPESNPMIFTFSKLEDSKVGELSFLDSTRTITNVSLIKILDNDEKLVYLEGNADSYLTVHTIYKKIGVSTYTKNINLAGIIPSTTSGMGSCVGY